MSSQEPKQIVIVNGGTSDPSSSLMIANRIADKTLQQLKAQEVDATVRVINLGPLSGEIAHSIVSGFAEGELLEAIKALATADGAIFTTPIYKAGMSGLFKSFIDILDNDLLIAKPVVLAASAGTARHSLVIDDQIRPLFAFMRTLVAPTSVFASPDDWGDTVFGRRIERAATELAALIASDVGKAITGKAWDKYQHNFGSNSEPGSGAVEVDFDSDLMRLATGGSALPQNANQTG